MSEQQVLTALALLREYPEIEDYIRTFNGVYGFLYTEETEPERIELNKQMITLLDDDSHSGASWGCMLRIIQDRLKG